MSFRVLGAFVGEMAGRFTDETPFRMRALFLWMITVAIIAFPGEERLQLFIGDAIQRNEMFTYDPSVRPQTASEETSQGKYEKNLRV